MSENKAGKNTFTEEGRLLQAEFAIKSVSEAGTIVGTVCTNGVILLGINMTKTDTLEKIYQVNKNSFVAVSGIFSDALRLLKFARVTSVQIKEEIGTLPKTSVLCDLISMEMQYYTQNVGARPFGVCFLFAGYENDVFLLYSIDPSGTINNWKACCFGSNEDSINSSLRNEINSLNCSVEDGVLNLLKILSKAKEWTGDFNEKLEILIFDQNGGKIIKSAEIKEMISKI
jgi:20S proteasome subunit alpha 3